MGYYVPETMKQLNNWLVWRKELVKGEWKKRPYSIKTRKMGGHTTPEAWANYEDAIAFLEHSGEYDGIGFAFSKSDNLVFIDVDSCITEDGEESELAKEVLELFPDTYTELSQSEKGLHFVCRGSIPYSFNNKTAGVEMYDWGRYMAFTGNAINPTEPQDKQEALNVLFAKYGTEEKQKTQTTPVTYITQITDDIENIIERIRRSKQGAKFDMLHSGRWESYGSPSQADQAYINIVNFFTGGNDEMTMAIYARSRLAERQKAERPDYIPRTIQKAKRTATGSQGDYTNINPSKKSRIIKSNVCDEYEIERKNRVKRY